MVGRGAVSGPPGGGIGSIRGGGGVKRSTTGNVGLAAELLP